MNTWRETILQAVVSRLTSANVAKGGVWRSRAEAFGREDLPAVVVKPGAGQVDNGTRGIAMRRLEIHLEVHARGTPADALTDPILAACHAALMADQTLGATVARLAEEGTKEPEYADGDETAVMVAATYTAIYATPTADNTRPI